MSEDTETPAEVATPPTGDEVLSDKPPQWLNAEFFQNALRTGLKDSTIVIEKCDVRPANAKGDNYASIVYRGIALDAKGKEHRSIIKCLPSNALRRMFSNKGEIFRKERDMYTVIFKKYKGMMLAVDEDRKNFPWPDFYDAKLDGVSDFIVLRDAGHDGFTMVDRKKGLDKDHLELVLGALAECHAYSVVVKCKYPEEHKAKVIDKYQELMFAKENKDITQWIVGAVTKFADEVKSWGGEKYNSISSILYEWIPTICDEVADLLAPVEGAVLNHGDCWVNNILFKYETDGEGQKKPVDVKLLDFQISRYASPAADLLYTMVTSTTAEIRRQHWDHLLKEAYLKTFWRVLEAHGVKGDIKDGMYSYGWLKSEFRRMRKWAVYSAAAVLPIIVIESEDVPNLDDLTEEDLKTATDFFKPGRTDRYTERCRGLIDDFDKDGVFQ